MAIPFRTAYSKKERHISESGTGIEKTYGYDVNSIGQKILTETGEKNLYEEIQSYAEECKIENILKRAAVGDMSDFRANGIYQDISEIPNNLIAAKKEMVKLENMWNKLPGETKAKYGWSLDEFMSEAGKESWLIDTGFINTKVTEETPVIKADKTTVETPKEVKAE